MQWFRLTCVLVPLAIAPLVLGGCGGSSPVPSQPSTAPTMIVSPSQIPPTNSPLAVKVEPSPIQAARAEIWSQLRQGKGYVVLFRHALAPGTGDPPNFRLHDCTTQRNLSAAGRQQAMRMGGVLRQQNIKVSRVLSSQWCRCLETAQLMNVGQVEPAPMLNSFFQNPSAERLQTGQLRQFILENRENTGVTIMVTHQVNITALSNVIPQAGAAIVVRATSRKQVEFIGKLNSL